MTQATDVDETPKKTRANGAAKIEPEPVEDPEESKAMTFWEHLDELRKRLIWSVIAFVGGCLVAWEVREKLLATLVKPFADAWHEQHIAGNPSLHFGAPGAAFVAYVKLSMIGGAAIGAPFIFYQLWSFVAPGLYAKEKRYVYPFVGLSTLLFVGGGYFGWRTAFPIAFEYFLSMSGSIGSQGVSIVPTVMMGEYLDFVTQMLLGFGLIFEIPIFLLFLSMVGLVNYLQLISWWRWFVLVAFIIAAILTPPDATSQCLMAFPMVILYTLSIGLAYLFGKKPSEAQRQAFRDRKKKDADRQ